MSRRWLEDCWKKDNSQKEVPKQWSNYVQSTRYLEVKKYSDWKDEFSEIRSLTRVGKWNHQGRYRIEIVLESIFRDRRFSWIRIVNEINKYVTETSQTFHLTTLSTELQEIPVRRKSRSQCLLRCCVLSPILFVTENVLTLKRNDSTKSVLHCQMP